MNPVVDHSAGSGSGPHKISIRSTVILAGIRISERGRMGQDGHQLRSLIWGS